MKKIIFILWCFIIALNSFGQDTDSILNKAIDEISIVTARYYVLKIDKKNLPDNISTSDKLLEVLNNRYKKDNEIKKLVKELQKYKEDYKQEPLNDYLKLVLSNIKFKKLDNKELLEKLDKIIGNYTNNYKSNKIEHNSQNFDKQDEKLKEIERLRQENSKLRDSLSYYQNNKPELKSESNFFAYALLVVVLMLLSIIAWLFKDKIFQLFKGTTKAETTTDAPNKKRKGNYFKENIEPNKFVMEDKKNVNDLTNSKQNTSFIPNNTILTKGNWFVVGSSVIGKSHIEGNIPCQDFNHLEKINDLWGIAVCCDGAGSAINSHIGSEFVAKESAKIFKSIFLKEQLGKNKELPQDNVWQELAKAGLYQVKQNLDDFAKKEGYKVESLACTIILAIYSPLGILVTHIGDGRAGFLTQNNEWKPMLTPWKGEEANQTVFITSAIWNENIDNYIESLIIREQPLAFTLMSDGCEAHSFECSVFDKETREWHDPNLPFPKFFNPLVQSLKQMKATGMTEDEVQKKWANFLTSGTQSLSNEPDDKTLILGVFVSENH
jgi:hypothetical protein